MKSNLKLNNLLENMQNNNKVKITIGFIFFLILFSFIFITLMPKQYEINVGQVVTEDIIAPRRIVDTQTGQMLRTQAELKTPNVYDYIPGILDESTNKINTFFTEIKETNNISITEEVVSSYNHIYSLNLTLAEYEYLFYSSDKTLNLINTTTISGLNFIYKDEVKSEELELAEENIILYFDESDLTTTQKGIAEKIATSNLKPNMIYNEEASIEAKKNASDSVDDIVYEAGAIIVKKGDILTQEQYDFLLASSIVKGENFSNLNLIIGLSLVVLLLIGIYTVYLRFFHKNIYYNNKILTLIAAQFIIMVFISQLTASFSTYFIPVSIMTMSLCVLVNPRVALQANLFLIIFLALTLNLNVDAFIYLCLSGFMSVIYMKKIHSRKQIFLSAITVSVTNLVIILVFAVLRENLSSKIFIDILYGLGNGLLAGIVVNGTLLLWESVFNILSPFRLVELSSPSNKIMRRMISEAPGTYHHSLLVSNLSHGACNKIGANSLLARVGAYYHDIGKCEKALFFKENQVNDNNPHDHLSPDVSARIIKNHVSDGIYLATKYKLPKEIIAFIQTHHGSSNIEYFYHKAKEQGLDVSDNKYSYNGILPKTKETSVVMLADSVEASVRSIKDPNKEKIKDMIDSIINRKITTGQLDQSHLSFHDIVIIKEEFLKILGSVYHERIEYPSDNNENIK